MTDDKQRLIHLAVELGASIDALSIAYADLLADAMIREFGDATTDAEDEASVVSQDPLLKLISESIGALGRKLARVNTALADDPGDPPF